MVRRPAWESPAKDSYSPFPAGNPDARRRAFRRPRENPRAPRPPSDHRQGDASGRPPSLRPMPCSLSAAARRRLRENWSSVASIAINRKRKVALVARSLGAYPLPRAIGRRLRCRLSTAMAVAVLPRGSPDPASPGNAPTPPQS